MIETRRSHTLGRVRWEGSAQADSGQPEGDARRVLRASANGAVKAFANIGDHLEEGQLIAEIHAVGDEGKPIDSPPLSSVKSPFSGVLRGLIHPSVQVIKGMKIGDVDPRDDPSVCYQISDKALAVGGGVLEAILSRPEFRTFD